MKKRLIILTILVISVSMVAFAGKNGNGNGAPSGSHYNLNLLGKTNCAGDDLVDTNRHNIQVLLYHDDGNQNKQAYTTLDRRNKIFLSPSPDDNFHVTDGNACDGDGASFQLPIDGAGGFTEYDIYVREVGSPNGNGTLTLCAVDDNGTPIDTSDDILACNTGDDVVVLERKNGQPVFRNVTTELTTLTCVDWAVTTDVTECDTVNLFDDSLWGYFWDYDNNGLRNVQLRFYPKPVE